MTDTPLTRGDFRAAVFARDKCTCVVPGCGRPAQDAHHILERRLFDDGGYYVNNGASVCGDHHIDCETTDISVEELREYAGITKPVLPPHIYADEIYDKWGNIVLPNGQRMRGELFYDESVQKILAQGNKLGLFTSWCKHPRTYHCTWSENMHDDDRMLPTMDSFAGRAVVVTEKMDGENTTMYRDHIHARSVTSGGHPARDWVKNFWSQIRHEIPEGWRICGENMYAKHSIPYDKLPSYFLGFSVWDAGNVCLSWDDTLEWFDLLGIKPVPVIFAGVYDGIAIRALWDRRNWEHSEGYVIRLASSFPYRAFRTSVAKFVRAAHVQTTKHWMLGQRIERNGLA